MGKHPESGISEDRVEREWCTVENSPEVGNIEVSNRLLCVLSCNKRASTQSALEDTVSRHESLGRRAHLTKADGLSL